MRTATRTFVRCRDCDRPMSSDRPRPPSGHVRYGAFGRCQACHRRSERHPVEQHEPATGFVHARANDVWPARP